MLIENLLYQKNTNLTDFTTSNRTKISVSMDKLDASQDKHLTKFEELIGNGSVNGVKKDKLSLEDIQREVLSRGKAQVSFWSVFCCRHFSCCTSQRLKKELKKYEIGKEKVAKTMDLIKVLREIRKIRIMQEIVMKKYQRALIPYFSQNMIAGKEKEEQEPSEKQFKMFLQQILMNYQAKKSLADKKIFKQLAIIAPKTDE